MKKLKKRWIIGVLLILLLAGIGGKLYMDKQTLNNEMIEIVKSDEAKKEIELGLLNLDPKALTSEGLIKSYEINFKSIERNPMGGIMYEVIINHDKELTLNFDVDKEDDSLRNGGIVISEKLSNLLDK